MFRYFCRSTTNTAKNMPAVMRVGMRAATMAAKDVEPPRCPPAPGVFNRRLAMIPVKSVKSREMVGTARNANQHRSSTLVDRLERVSRHLKREALS